MPRQVARNKSVSVVGANPSSDIASGRAHIVRWTMDLRRPKRSVDAAFNAPSENSIIPAICRKESTQSVFCSGR